MKQAKRHMDLNVQGDLVTSNPLSFRNVLINGNFDVWQRGTSQATTGTTYLADRWATTMSATGVNYTYAQSTDVPNLNSLYSAKVTQSAGGSATSTLEYAVRQPIEMSNVLNLIGKPITVSFWYKSSMTGTHGIRVIAANMTGATDINTAFTVAAANTWQYVTATFSNLQSITAITGAANGVGLYLDVGPRVGGGVSSIGQSTIPANGSFNIAQVQLEAGSSATPFERRPIGMELQLCQRYFQTWGGGAAQFEGMGFGQCSSTTTGSIPIYLFVPFRATPALSIDAATSFSLVNANGGTVQCSAVVLSGQVTFRTVRIDCTVSSGLVAGNATFLVTNTTNARLNLSAEL